ncbi:MAG: hypothetical protein KME64_23055 [Scytonematopsis contorta HA4267-MV1]|jgi:hypothetical protein|nr:hypothetical protein [Scytonematopsis contorta HA4267-MV1]
MISISDLSCLRVANEISIICGGTEVTQSAYYSQSVHVSNGTSSWYDYKISSPSGKVPSLKTYDLKIPSFSISDLHKFLSDFFKSYH